VQLLLIYISRFGPSSLVTLALPPVHLSAEQTRVISECKRRRRYWDLSRSGASFYRVYRFPDFVIRRLMAPKPSAAADRERGADTSQMSDSDASFSSSTSEALETRLRPNRPPCRRPSHTIILIGASGVLSNGDHHAILLVPCEDATWRDGCERDDFESEDAVHAQPRTSTAAPKLSRSTMVAQSRARMLRRYRHLGTFGPISK
jgi:hypothetical protein